MPLLIAERVEAVKRLFFGLVPEVWVARLGYFYIKLQTYYIFLLFRESLKIYIRYKIVHKSRHFSEQGYDPLTSQAVIARWVLSQAVSFPA